MDGLRLAIILISNSSLMACYSGVFSPSGTVYNGLALGDWVSEQIKAFRDGNLIERRRALMENVGFGDTFAKIETEKQSGSGQKQQEKAKRQHEENSRIDPAWLRMFSSLVEYKESHGNCDW